MEPGNIAIIVSIVGAVTTFGTLVISGVRGKRADELAAQELALKKQTDAEKAKTDLNDRIDGRVEVQLEKAWKKIDELEDEVKKLKEDKDKKTLENLTIRQAVKQWFINLIHWDRLGRNGRMPLPSQSDLDLLQLDPNEPTLTADQILALRKQVKA
jgi:hypothetical protein